MFKWLKKKLERIAKRRTIIDKRRTTKLDGQLAVKVGAAGWPAHLKKLSSKNIHIVVGRWQKQDTSLSVTLYNKKTGYSCTVQGRIIKVVACRDGMWDIRCVFDQTLDTAQLEALLQK